MPGCERALRVSSEGHHRAARGAAGALRRNAAGATGTLRMINSVFGLRNVPLVGGRALLLSRDAVRENEEVGPVTVSTWVLHSGVTVGR